MNISAVIVTLLLLCLFKFLFAYEVSNVTRTGKFFGVGVVRFENGVCVGDSLQGTCYTKRQCREVGGVATTSCAKGIGVCCVLQITCGGSSSYNNTYFVSPNFPSSYAGGSSCTMTIKKCNPGICQVRIDFLALTLAQPNDNGVCVTDSFTATGGAGNVPILCGDLSGQHIYVDFNGDSDIQILINTAATPLIGRSWNIKVAQIACDCPNRAPAGCLQYYTALSGTVRSFNYGPTVTATGTRQLANENYGICVEMQPGYCSIQWTQSTGDPFSFSVSGDTFTDVNSGVPPVVMSGADCTTDYIVVPNPQLQDSDRFCGNILPPLTSFSKPFVLNVITNGDEIGDAGNRGFSLMYTQQRCTNTIAG